MSEISSIFNIAIPGTIVAAGVCFTVMTGLMNHQTQLQDVVRTQRLSDVLEGLDLLVRTRIDPRDFIQRLRNNKADVVPIPDRVKELAITKANIFAGIILAFSLVGAAFLLEIAISEALLVAEVHRASFLLCAGDMIVVILCIAWAFVTAQRVEGWTGVIDILRPNRRM